MRLAHAAGPNLSSVTHGTCIPGSVADKFLISFAIVIVVMMIRQRLSFGSYRQWNSSLLVKVCRLSSCCLLSFAVAYVLTQISVLVALILTRKCLREFAPITSPVTVKFDNLWTFKINWRVIYLDQRSFSLKVIVQTTDRLLYLDHQIGR